MGKRLDTMVTGATLFLAITVGASVVYRTFLQKPATPSRGEAKPQFVQDWHEAFGPGSRVAGDSTAKVSIIEFADLECPYCARYQATLDSVASRYPKDVQIVYIGFPLDFHRFALPAARAAECAAEHGQVSAWMRAVYSKQDSLGIKSWASFARDAGIIDTLMIHRCAVDPAAVKRIVEGRDFGKRINVTGTPTVMVNGWVYLYSAAPRAGKLSALIDTLLAGKKPFRS